MTTFRFSPNRSITSILCFTMVSMPSVYAWAESAHDAATEEHHESGGLPQLNSDSYVSQVFWLLLCFTILYIFLSRHILPQMTEIIEKRENLIASDLERAAHFKEEADKTQEAYEQALSQAEDHAYNFLIEATEQLSSDMGEQTVQAAQTIHSSLDHAKNKIEKEKDQAILEIQASVEEFSDEIISILVSNDNTKPTAPKKKTTAKKTATTVKTAKVTTAKNATAKKTTTTATKTATTAKKKTSKKG